MLAIVVAEEDELAPNADKVKDEVVVAKEEVDVIAVLAAGVEAVVVVIVENKGDEDVGFAVTVVEEAAVLKLKEGS